MGVSREARMRKSLVFNTTFCIGLLFIFACGGKTTNTVDTGVDMGQPEVSPEIIQDEGVGKEEVSTELPEEEVIPPECTKETEKEDCKDKFPDVGKCQVVFCNTEKGKCDVKPAEDNSPCDDGDICTDGDHCEGGVCLSGDDKCECRKDEDCSGREDGDLCNGTLICDLQNFPYKCIVDPKTVVTCDPKDDQECLKNQCDPKTGKCVMSPANEGGECDDGNICTTVSKCVEGECKGIEFKNCEDTNPCTDDSCDPKLGCIHIPNNAPCDDGNICTENDKCENSKCVPGTPKKCDNGQFCDGEETCDPEKGCVAGTPPSCDDNIPCTKDYCDPLSDDGKGKCIHEFLESAKEGPKNSETCSDGNDNDCDGLVDEKDPQCNYGISGVSPKEGPSAGGTVISISGTNLALTKKVRFGGQDVDFVIESATKITATTPGGEVGDVSITISDGVVEFTLENAFRYTGKTEDANVDVKVSGPDKHVMKEGETSPSYSLIVTIGGAGGEPNIKAQIGWGEKGTNPWEHPSWKWVDADLKSEEGGISTYEKALNIAVGGYFNVAGRFSTDGGYTFIFGDKDGSQNGYDPNDTLQLTVFGVPKPGSIVINEIMWMGSNDDTFDEWIELRNMTPAPFDLSGFQITNAGNAGASFILDDPKHTVNNIILAPYGYFLISEFDETKSAVDVKPDIVGNNTMMLSNPGATPITYQLKDKDLKVIDTAVVTGNVGYDGQGQYGKPDKSMERNAKPDVGTNDKNWHTAYWHENWDGDPYQTKNWGTPRAPNSDIATCKKDEECKDAFPKVQITECEKRVCDKGVGGRCNINPIGDGEPCDDGLFCNEGETCMNGKCQGGKPKDCDDGIACTIDTCDEEHDKCKHEADVSQTEGPGKDSTCYDKLDNDCDQLTDEDDPQCQLMITSVNPSKIPTEGGWEVTLEGGGFDIVKQVLIGKQDAGQFTVDDETHILIPSIIGVDDVGDYDVSVSDGFVTFTLEKGIRFIGMTDEFWGNTQWPDEEITVTAGQETDMIFGQVYVDGITNAGGDPNLIMVEIGYGPAGSDPHTTQGWVWKKAEYNQLCAACGENYEYMATLVPEIPGVYIIAFRYSIDGGYTWVYGDLGDGSADGFNPDDALGLTVLEP